MPTRIGALTQQIESLRRQFLPSVFNPLGVYPRARKVQAHTRAFLVLSHAEIESYLEEWAKEVARAAENVWKSSGRVSTPLAFLLGTLGERVITPNAISVAGAKDSHQRFGDAINTLFPSYYKKIKDNNGIKEKNVVALFDPLGVPSTAYGATLLPNLDAFGSMRGKHAHHSARAVASVLDPETEYKRVTALLSDLAPFEAWLVAYRRKVR